MDSTIIAAVIGGFLTLLVNQWLLHLQNRRDRHKEEKAKLEQDNKLAFLLENFPPHAHHAHEGITYPAGLDPRR